MPSLIFVACPITTVPAMFCRCFGRRSVRPLSSLRRSATPTALQLLSGRRFSGLSSISIGVAIMAVVDRSSAPIRRHRLLYHPYPAPVHPARPAIIIFPAFTHRFSISPSLHLYWSPLIAIRSCLFGLRPVISSRASRPSSRRHVFFPNLLQPSGRFGCSSHCPTISTGFRPF